jgi:DNA-binding IclR family transcriptional regulator
MPTGRTDESDPEVARGVAVLRRMFALLEAFRGSDELSLAELARRSGLPKTTAHRLVGLLVSEQILERRGNDYRLGLRLFELGELVPRKRSLREAALPFLQDLFEATHETIHLAVLDGTDVVYLERISGHRKVKAPSAVGGRFPAHATGVGKALLAFTPDAARTVLARPLLRVTPYTITAPNVLADELRRIAAAGVAFDREESTPGVSCVAAPVLVGHEAVAALSVTGPSARMQPETLAPAVRTAALGLARVLAAGRA